MSYQIGLDVLNLRPTPRYGHAAFCSNNALKRHLGVRDTVFGPAEQQFATGGLSTDPTAPTFEDLWECDFLWNTHDGPVGWAERGRTTDMGHADFLEGGVDRREPKPSPFHNPADVWAFDAVQEYGLPDFAGLVKFYEQQYQHAQAANPNQVVTGGYYKTLVSGAIEAFGWDALLEAAADQDQFEKVLDSFFRLTLHHARAWAQTSAPVYINHDDMVWTEGAFLHPEFYRRVIFPRYQALWKVLHAAGKKVIFCSDGNFAEFVAYVADAGADGFICEPMLPLEAVVACCGQTHVIISSKLDARTLTFGTLTQIQAEIDATLRLAEQCRGFMFAVGNHIPSNVPVENALFYFDYLHTHWNRQ